MFSNYMKSQIKASLSILHLSQSRQVFTTVFHRQVRTFLYPACFIEFGQQGRIGGYEERHRWTLSHSLWVCAGKTHYGYQQLFVKNSFPFPTCWSVEASMMILHVFAMNT